jgi:DNA-binding transcriptional regulator GbsR (MarR family)
MTETTARPNRLPAPIERFVLHWGEMGTTWGVNRSVGQIHALLYLSERPLTAEEIAETLELARSNVSTSLKELQTWGLIRRVHVRGDRRDHFEAEADLWEMVTRIAEGRKAREIDPTLAVLRQCEAEANATRFMSETARGRIAAMREFLEMMDTWAADIRRVPRGKLKGLIKLGSAIVRFLPGRTSAPTAPPAPRGRDDDPGQA